MKKWKKNIRSFKDSNNLVAEIIGTVLLLGIAVVIFSTLYIVVFAYPFPTSSPNVTLIGTIEGSNIIIEHHSGEALSLDTEIPIVIAGEKMLIDGKTPTARDLLDDTSREDDLWNIGERIVYPFNYSRNCTQVDIMTVDIESNSLVLMGTLDIHPECDVGVKYTIDKSSLYVGNYKQFNIVATSYRGDIDEIGIKINITLPDEDVFPYIYNTTGKGSYDHTIGIWSISNLTVGESVALTIYTLAYSENPTGIAKIVSSTLRDVNPTNDVAFLTIVS